MFFILLHCFIYGVFSFPFFKKIGFWSIILQNRLNTMQFFLAKRWLFSILYFDFKRQKTSKRASRGSHEDNKFCILNGTNHDPDFGILYFITPK